VPLLASLESVDWNKASHTRGLATDVPDLLRALIDPSQDVRDAALRDLADRLEHQMTVWSASSKAVPFLVEVLMMGPADRALRRSVFDLLSGLVGAHLEVLPDRFDPEEYFGDVEDPGTWRDEYRWTEHETDELLEQMSGVWGKACYDAIEAELPRLMPLLQDPDDELACGFISLLEIYPNSASSSVPPLRELVGSDLSEVRQEAAQQVIEVLTSTDSDDED
jgi:hypothetical protein